MGSGQVLNGRDMRDRKGPQKIIASELVERQRPELPNQSVLGKCRLHFFGGRWVPVDIHSGPIPIPGHVVHGLGRDYGTLVVSGLCEPVLQLDFRPEAKNVCSGEDDIVPKSSGRHEEMHETLW